MWFYMLGGMSRGDSCGFTCGAACLEAARQAAGHANFLQKVRSFHIAISSSESLRNLKFSGWLRDSAF